MRCYSKSNTTGSPKLTPDHASSVVSGPPVRVSDLGEVFVRQDQFAPPDDRGKLGEWVANGIKVLGPRVQAVSAGALHSR